jgi:hypothetical protein
MASLLQSFLREPSLTAVRSAGILSFEMFSLAGGRFDSDGPVVQPAGLSTFSAGQS